jgi:hypothetical protein
MIYTLTCAIESYGQMHTTNFRANIYLIKYT